MGALRRLWHLLGEGSDSFVRVVFEGDDRLPLFECAACELLLAWDSGEGWWRCAECGYEMTPPDAEGLLNLAVLRILLMREDVRRKQGKRPGWARRLWGWFTRR